MFRFDTGQTLIEYPTLYLGTAEHTVGLHTLIAAADGGGEEDEEESCEEESEDDDKEDRMENNTKAGSTEKLKSVSADAMAEEGMDVVAEESHFSSERISNTAQSGAAKKVTFTAAAGEALTASVPVNASTSSALLGLEQYGSSDDEEDNDSGNGDAEGKIQSMLGITANATEMSGLTNRINTSNIADIVGNMKKFIDSTLMDTAKSNNSRGGEGNDSDEGDGEEGEEDDEEEGGDNEEFLAALKDLADKDIDTLKAIIAAEEEEDGEEGEV